MAAVTGEQFPDRNPLRNNAEILLAAIICIILIFGFFATQQNHADRQAAVTSQTAREPVVRHAAAGVEDRTALRRSMVPAINPEPGTHTNAQNNGTTIDWRAPSGGVQPKLANYRNLNITVDLSAQRVYVRSNDKTIYTMIASTGLHDSTPHGDFTINGRGDHFYNPSEGWGADYWVSFRNNVYLFHTVPTKQDAGSYVVSEAVKLGHPASHGCVRLTLADAKWLYDQVPDGTPVHIG